MRKLLIALFTLLSLCGVMLFASCDKGDNDPPETPQGSETPETPATPVDCKGSHTWGPWQTLTAANCTTTGKDKRSCTVCNESETATTPVTNEHDFDEIACTVCGKQLTQGLSYTQINAGTAYEVSGIGTATQTDIVIPNTYSGKPVRRIGAGAFSGCSSLTGVELPASITRIGEEAFSDCISLTSITVPSSVIAIGSRAFYGCTALASIEISWSVASISYDAFHGCTSLESIEVDADNTTYRSAGNCLITSKTLFIGCKNSVIPTDGSVTGIGEKAFFGCKLETLVIPSSVTSIGKAAFSSCSNLSSVIFEANGNLKSIAEDAFLNCSALGNLTLPSTVTSIAATAFSGCINAIEKEHGISYVDKWAIACDTSVTTFSLRQDTVGIGEKAFQNCSALTDITVPSSVISICSSAFKGCSKLQRITLPFLGSRADGTGSTHLGYIFGASSYTANGSSVPAELRTAVITGGTTLAACAFFGCTNLIKIELPKSITSVGFNAFRGCSSLTRVTFGEHSQLQRIEAYAFSECPALENVTLGNSGWRVTETGGVSPSITVDVSSEIATATHLKSTYCACIWERG